MSMWVQRKLLSLNTQLYFVTHIYTDYYEKETYRIANSQTEIMLENILRLNYILDKSEHIIDQCKINFTRNSLQLEDNLRAKVKKILLEATEEMVFVFLTTRAEFTDAESFALMIRREVKFCKIYFANADRCLAYLHSKARLLARRSLKESVFALKEFNNKVSKTVNFTEGELQSILHSSEYTSVEFFAAFLNCILQAE